MVGIWLRGESRLYLSNETVLNPVDQYECIGAGAYLAKYLIGQYRKANSGTLSLQDASLIARHAVQAAIDYDGRCGGSPEIVAIKSDGTFDRQCGDIYFPNEAFVSGLFELSWKLLRDLANTDALADSTHEIDVLAKRIKEIEVRERWRWV